MESKKCFLLYYFIWLLGLLGESRGRLYFYLLYQKNCGADRFKMIGVYLCPCISVLAE